MSEKIHPSWLKPALEFGPILGFFIAYLILKERVFTIAGADYAGFVVVTAGFVPLFLLSILLLWRLTGHLSKMQIVTAVVIVVFGGLSVWFNDSRFFMMKPTIIYLIFAAILGAGLLRGRSYLHAVMDGALPLSARGWIILTRRLALFFLALAILNEVIWRTQTEEAWVYFKTFGLTAAVFLFFMTQGRLFERHGTGESDGDKG